MKPRSSFPTGNPGHDPAPQATRPAWQRPGAEFQQSWLPDRFMRSTLLHLGMLADEAHADLAGAFLAMKGYTRDGSASRPSPGRSA